MYEADPDAVERWKCARAKTFAKARILSIFLPRMRPSTDSDTQILSRDKPACKSYKLNMALIFSISPSVRASTW